MARDAILPYETEMNRRQLLASVAASTFLNPALAQAAEWETRLITSSASGELLYGLHIKLARGWKTYWRVPGVAGIPPAIKLAGPDIESFTVDYPLPIRIIDESGEALGYHDEVVFILRPKLKPEVKPEKVSGTLSAFFGVCQNICRPVKFAADLSSAVADDSLMQQFQKRVPRASDFATKATQKGDQLEIALNQVVQDLFIDGPAELYFHKPTFGMGYAKLKIDGLTPDQKIQGKELKMTAVVDGDGLEQTVIVA